VNRAYFEKYCQGGPYAQTYLYYSGIEHCIHITERLGLRVHSVMVLGAATGEVLRHFERAWGILPQGCEISRWAHGRIPARYRRRIARQDMRRYLPASVARGVRVDLLFSNSLVYLEERDVPEALAHCRAVTRYFHFLSSTAEDYEAQDTYRVTLRPRAWWREQFLAAGFAPTRSRYLFK
jgi:hypothetical protein